MNLHRELPISIDITIVNQYSLITDVRISAISLRTCNVMNYIESY